MDAGLSLKPVELLRDDDVLARSVLDHGVKDGLNVIRKH